ncbi:hypothetical protein FHT86_000848 [Rhizobium sp. BK313]|uniref:hypothetical protein n=1 Tax=Rhizobium sp. BK313 TaxID=2587081 RepID=UPI0010612229|nr:hypothetical protein [Rhizobium sp. BK313]MBB3452592.1 hypothetical protein [Rhizobium sp. BK313]
MSFTLAVKDALDFVSTSLYRLTRSSSAAVSLKEIAQVTERACADEDGLALFRSGVNTSGQSAATIFAANYPRSGRTEDILGKLATQAFVCQFKMSFDPVANVHAIASDVIHTLTDARRRKKMSEGLTSAVEKVEHDLAEPNLDQTDLMSSIDEVLALCKPLPKELNDQWQVAKDAYLLRAIFEKRREMPSRLAEIKPKRKPVPALVEPGTETSLGAMADQRLQGARFLNADKYEVIAGSVDGRKDTHHDLEEMLKEVFASNEETREP